MTDNRTRREIQLDTWEEFESMLRDTDIFTYEQRFSLMLVITEPTITSVLAKCEMVNIHLNDNERMILVESAKAIR